MSKQARRAKLMLHFDAYLSLLKNGLSHEQALGHLNYLHPVTHANLRDYIERWMETNPGIRSR